MLKSVFVLIYGDVLNYTAVLKLTIICLPQLFTAVMDFSRFQQLQDIVEGDPVVDHFYHGCSY